MRFSFHDSSRNKRKGQPKISVRQRVSVQYLWLSRSNRPEPAISLHLGTQIDDRLVLRVCALNTSKKLPERNARFCRGSRRRLPLFGSYSQICSAYTYVHNEETTHAACSRLGWLASLRAMSLYLEGGGWGGIPLAQLILSKQTDRRTGWPAGIGCEYCCGNQVAPVDNIDAPPTIP